MNPHPHLHPHLITPASGRPFELIRRFAAPRALVFSAFTQAEHLQRWIGPAGMPVLQSSLEPGPGGYFHYALQTPGGTPSWGLWTYREIQPPQRLVLIVQFSDADRGATRHPATPDWPLYTLCTLDFEPVGAATELTLRAQALAADDAEHDAFDAAHVGMQQGWGGSFAQLDIHLARLQAGLPQ